MLKSICYKGPLATDLSIPGERKSDGVIPAHGTGALRVSRNRWLLFFSTLDPNGWDAVRSIVYQLREESPDGPVLKEGMVAQYLSGWDPLGLGISLRKAHGMPMAFGVPKGATRNGKPMPNQNVFAVKWYRRALLEQDGRLLQSNTHQDLWPEGPEINRLLLRVEWMQFRLNDAEDDIEVLLPPQQLRQKGYESGEAFCSLDEAQFMNHAMTPPVPTDDTCTAWVACETFGSLPGQKRTQGRVAPVAYTWNAQTRLFEWARTGPLTLIPGRVVGETSISRFNSYWVVAARSFNIEAGTVWYRTDDPFSGLAEPIVRPGSVCPRHSFRCADGVLRLFINDRKRSPYNDKRNPLYVFEVDPETFVYSEPRVVVDLRAEGIPFPNPFADMAKLCPHQGDRQLLIFRTIDRQMTADPQPGEAPLTEAAMAAGGIHYAELRYSEAMPETWTFET